VETWQVVIDSGTRSPSDLLSELRRIDLSSIGVDVELVEPPFTLRGLDPVIVVATIGAVSTALTALIAGIFQLRGVAKDEMITVEFADGKVTKIIAPASMPADERDRLFDTLAGKRPIRLIVP
jgi:hypothetical protein